MADPYEAYYYRQATGAGLPVFSGVSVQRGHGIGNLLNAAFRLIAPVIKSAGRGILKQGVNTGATILTDVLGGESLKQSAHRRAVEGGKNLMVKALAARGRKMAGGPKRKAGRRGQKRRVKRAGGQFGSGRPRKRKPSSRRRASAKRKVCRRKRASKSVVDIFS